MPLQCLKYKGLNFYRNFSVGRPSVCACVRPSVRPSVRASVRATVRPCMRPSVRPTVRATVRLCVRPSVRACDRASVRPSVRACDRPSVRQCVRPCVCATVRQCVRPCVRPSIRASVCPSIRHKELVAAEWRSYGVKSPNTSLPILPKFDVTVNGLQIYSVAVMGLKVESCAKYTYGQPVPGQALVEMNATGCASLTVDTSVFFNTKFEDQMQDTFLVNVNVSEEGTAVVTQFKIRTSTTFIQNFVLRAGADSYYSITMSRTERQATSVPPVVRPRRQVIPQRYLDDFYVDYTVPHQFLHSDEQPTNGATGSEPVKIPESLHDSISLENLLPAEATERFTYQILDHLKQENALLIADSYVNSRYPYTNTMRSLTALYGQLHQLALQRIAELMDGPKIRSGDTIF
ncbi:hypothetical protein F2P79_021873 [Pimephales promelas]|nr:hypothetical protein F2P79_021873 [Pimephales promelas]